MISREGQKIPSLVLRIRDEHKGVDVSSEQLFSGRNVVVFSLPGAFTPTCSSSHVPRFNLEIAVGRGGVCGCGGLGLRATMPNSQSIQG